MSIGFPSEVADGFARTHPLSHIEGFTEVPLRSFGGRTLHRHLARAVWHLESERPLNPALRSSMLRRLR
jgi:hypothetical protein